MNTCTALRCATLSLAIGLAGTACASLPKPHVRNIHDTWLDRTLAAREAALDRAYNACHLHALRDDILPITRIHLPDGRRIDPVVEARKRVCGHLRRQVMPDSLAVREVGDKSALVTGVEQYCAIGTMPCTTTRSRFAQLWTLEDGRWRIGWMRRAPIRTGR